MANLVGCNQTEQILEYDIPIHSNRHDWLPAGEGGKTTARLGNNFSRFRWCWTSRFVLAELVTEVDQPHANSGRQGENVSERLVILLRSVGRQDALC